MSIDHIVEYAARIRAIRRAAPTNLEQALAPAFQHLLEALLPTVSATPLTVVPEFATPGVGRPDIALIRPGQPARAFVELKAPTKPDDPTRYRDPHDRAQFERFKSLPVWAISNFKSFRIYRRDELIDSVEIVPDAALAPETSDESAARAIRRANLDFGAVLLPLALADPPPAADANALASNLAHAARLVRAIIEDRLKELADAQRTDAPLQAVRDEFREVLYAHPQAGGYNAKRFDPLFAAAFAQTLAFGLLLVREATGVAIHANSWRAMPAEHSLMRTTLRVLSEEEIAHEVGVGFDVIVDTVNSFDPAILVRRPGRGDPILYFYENFLETFDPAARERFGVYYTPVEVVSYMVGALDRALRDNLGTTGLADDSVTILDPAAGTGTFLLGVIERVRESVEASAGPGAVGGALRALANRLFGFELLVGPYAVAHYRLRHALGGLSANRRVGVFLTDTLAEPGAAAPAGRLGFVAENIREERREADRIKQRQPILAIIGNPPYRRLAEGEIGELVGNWMNEVWDDLKAPVRLAGWGNQLNTFPELSVAFWRWAIWKLFDSEGASGRGVVAFITNRTFLAGKPYAGLRKMLRERFDRIEIIDLRGDVRRGERAGVEGDQGVFNIQVGTAITLAIADGSNTSDGRAQVTYFDCWANELFSRRAKLSRLEVANQQDFHGLEIERSGLEDFKPLPFAAGNWADLPACFSYRKSGVKTQDDENLVKVRREDLRVSVTPLLSTNRRYQPNLELNYAYRPLDRQWLYNEPLLVRRYGPELQAAWGRTNACLYALPSGTGAGPAVWCHGLLPDYHSFRGSYGGYAFPLRDNRPGHGPYNILKSLLDGLAEHYGVEIPAQDAFDAILALLSATSYTTRFAEDLEDVFPHVPFPSQLAQFREAVALSAEIRAVETFARAPGRRFLTATLARVETEPTGPLHASDWRDGEIRLCSDGGGLVTGIPLPIWTFEVSGYRLLFRWLDARQGLPVDHALLTALRDLVGRIAELIDLFARADEVLTRVLPSTLSRDALGLAGTATVDSNEAPDA